MASAFQKLLFLTRKKNKSNEASSKSSKDPQKSKFHSYHQPILTTSSLNSASGSRDGHSSSSSSIGSSSGGRGRSNHLSSNRPRASTLDSSSLLYSRQFDQFGSRIISTQKFDDDDDDQEGDQDEDEDDPDSNPIYQIISTHPDLRQDWRQTTLIILPRNKSLETKEKGKGKEKEKEIEVNDTKVTTEEDWRENLSFIKSHCFIESGDVKEKWMGVKNEVNREGRIRFLQDLERKENSLMKNRRKKKEGANEDWDQLFLEICLELSTQDSKIHIEILYLSEVTDSDVSIEPLKSDFQLKTIRKTLKVLGEITVYPTPLPSRISNQDPSPSTSTLPSASTPKAEVDAITDRRSIPAGFEVLSRDTYQKEKERKETEASIEKREVSSSSNDNNQQQQQQPSISRKSSKKWRVKVLSVDGLLIPTSLSELESEWKDQNRPTDLNVDQSSPSQNLVATSKDQRSAYNGSSNPNLVFDPPSPSHSIVFPTKPEDRQEIIPTFIETSCNSSNNASDPATHDKKMDFRDLGLKGNDQPFGKGRRNSSPLLSRMKTGGADSLGSELEERDGNRRRDIVVPKSLLDLYSLLTFPPHLLESNLDHMSSDTPNLSNPSLALSTEQISSLRSLTRSTLSKLIKSRDSLSSFVYINGFEEYCQRKAEEKIFRPTLDSFLLALDQIEVQNASSSTVSTSNPLTDSNLLNLKSNMRSILRNISEGLMFPKFYYPTKKNLQTADSELDSILQRYRDHGIDFKDLGIEKVWKVDKQGFKNSSSFSNIQDYFSGAFDHKADHVLKTDENAGFQKHLDGLRKRESHSEEEILKGAILITRSLGIERENPCGEFEQDDTFERHLEDQEDESKAKSQIQIQVSDFLNDPFGLESSITNLVSRVQVSKFSSKEEEVSIFSKDVQTPSEMISTFQNLIKEIGNEYTRIHEKSSRIDSSSPRINSGSSSAHSFQHESMTPTERSSIDRVDKSKHDLKLSPDDLFPTMAYLIIQSDCTDLVSKLAYIKAFGSGEIDNEQRWALTTFDLVVEWLRTDPLSSQITSKQLARKNSNASQIHRTTSIGSQRSIGRPDSSHSHSHSNSSSQILTRPSISNKARSNNNANHIRSLSPRPAIFKDGNWSSSTDLLEITRPMGSRSNSFIRDSTSNRERRISLPLSNSHFNQSGDSLGGVIAVGSDEGHQSSSGASINTFKLPSHPASASRRVISVRSNIHHPRPGSFLESVGEGLPSSIIDESTGIGEGQIRSSSSASRSTGDLLNQYALVREENRKTSARSESLRSNRLDGSGGSSNVSSSGNHSNHFSNSHSRATSSTTVSSTVNNPSSPAPSFGSSSELQIRPQIIVRSSRRPMTSSGGGGSALERSGSEISSRSLSNHHHIPPKTRVVGSNSSTGSASSSSWSQIMSRTLSDRSPSSPTSLPPVFSNHSNDSDYSQSESISGLGTITPKSIRPNSHPRRKSLDSWTALNMFSSLSILSPEVKPIDSQETTSSDKNTNTTPQVILPSSDSSSSSFGFNSSTIIRSPSDSNSDNQSIKTPSPITDSGRRVSYASTSSNSPNLTGISNHSNPSSASGWFSLFLTQPTKSNHPSSGSSDSSRPGSIYLEAGSENGNSPNLNTGAVSFFPTSSPSISNSKLPRSISNSGSISGFSSLGSGGEVSSGNEDNPTHQKQSQLKEERKRSSIVIDSSNNSTFKASFPSNLSNESSKFDQIGHHHQSQRLTTHRRNQSLSGNPRLRLLSNSSLAPPQLQRSEAAAENPNQSLGSISILNSTSTSLNSRNSSPLVGNSESKGLLPSFMSE